MSTEDKGFKLSELIETAANEIREARKEKIDDPVMEFSGCEISLAVTVAAEGEAGFRFWIVNAKAGAKVETISHITLKFGAIQGSAVQYVNAAGGGAGPENPTNENQPLGHG